MELVDICPLERWAALEDDIYERSGLNPAVYDINGFVSIKTLAGQIAFALRLKPNQRGRALYVLPLI